MKNITLQQLPRRNWKKNTSHLSLTAFITSALGACVTQINPELKTILAVSGWQDIIIKNFFNIKENPVDYLS